MEREVMNIKLSDRKIAMVMSAYDNAGRKTTKENVYRKLN